MICGSSPDRTLLLAAHGIEYMYTIDRVPQQNVRTLMHLTALSHAGLTATPTDLN